MLTLFFDCSGPLRIEFLGEGATVNSDRYVQTLSDLKKDIRNTRRNGPAPTLLLHDNARPYTARRTVNAIQRLHYELLSHPPYSPDLAPADFALYPRLKKFLRGRIFENRDSLEQEVRRTINFDIPREEFGNAMDSLYRRWQKCIQIKGDHVKKVHLRDDSSDSE